MRQTKTPDRATVRAPTALNFFDLPPPHSRVRGAAHVPTLTGGTGRERVERFYRDHFIGHWPTDVEVNADGQTALLTN